MNVSLTKELEDLVKTEVKKGHYANASEVIRHCVRETLIPSPRSVIDPDVDSPELAALLRKSINSPTHAYVPGQFTAQAKKRIARFRATGK